MTSENQLPKKDLLAKVTAIVSLLAIAIPAGLAIIQYTSNLKTEEQVAYAQKTELEIKIMDTFFSFTNIANGHRRSQMSDNSLNKFLGYYQEDLIPSKNKDSLYKLIDDNLFYSEPVAITEQLAAISSIGYLANKHDFLEDIGLNVLQNLYPFD